MESMTPVGADLRVCPIPAKDIGKQKQGNHRGVPLR